jgi:putative ABC transport system permease protein
MTPGGAIRLRARISQPVGLRSPAALVLAGMLYGVSPSDATTLFAVVLLILTVAAGASLLPAARAARVDPMQVLREE